jgi:hypothetical protein
MLRNIDYQIHADEKQQQQLESTISPFIQRRYNSNIEALAHHDLQLAQRLAVHECVDHSPVITKSKHVNIARTLRGRALYDINPERQVKQQLEDFCQGALLVDVNASARTESAELPEALLTLDNLYPQLNDAYQAPQKDVEALVILGCGLGLHLDRLLALKAWKRVILVEPSLDLLRISLFSAQWKSMLGQLAACECQLSIVYGQSGLSNLTKIIEWQQQNQIERFYLFRHYNYLPFNLMEHQLATGQLAFKDLGQLRWSNIEEERQFECCFSLNHFLIGDPEKSSALEQQGYIYQQRIATNLEAFKRTFPEVHHAFSHYVSGHWRLFLTDGGGVNLVDIRQGVTLFGGDPKLESETYFEHYAQAPRLDALDARKAFRKPSPFVHYKQSDRLKDLVADLPEETNLRLPSMIPSFIMYGCGMGYQIERLLLEYQVNHFMLYEPCHDFFYASLATIDWKAVLDLAEKEERCLYLNIGDDGSNMFDDIHRQLQMVGINILSYTFFYVSYFNVKLDNVIRQTREQFRILTNISEFFDHGFFNITHTNESLRRGCNYMLRKKTPEIQRELAQTPIFIVGNGPSLDSCASIIRDNQDKAIIVSCGTSLKALYALGIKPDFHAEVEQTRATSLWVSQVPDAKWLKEIDVITVNGIHPEVLDLFNEAYICLKTGEAASMTHYFADPEFAQFDSILYSYPTVSNCALASIIQLGFKQVYLFGVDLGFKDPKRHHSQHSAYFNAKDGKELYDYSAHGVGLRVPGNFDDSVFTKHEFKFSAEILGLTLAEATNVDCFNTSDGARIEGTLPLDPEHVLLVNEPLDKAGFKQRLKDQAYRHDVQSFAQHFDVHYQKERFLTHFNAIYELTQTPCESWEAVLGLMNEHGKLLGRAARDDHSLYYNLMRGSSSFCLTYLTRLAFHCADETQCMEAFKQGQQVWGDYLQEAKDFYIDHYGEFDTTNAPVPGAQFESLPALEN